MGIGDRLNSLLQKRGRNINELAIAINVSPQTLYSISKRNNTKVDLDVLQKIADELAVTLDYFCTDFKNDNNLLILSDIEKQLVIAYRNHIDMQPAINKMLDITDDSDNIVNKPKQKKIEPQKIISFAARNGKGGTIELNDEQAEKLQNVLESDFPELL